ncbi:hypothetical protein Tco_0933594 [Tanacetum coccineum]
MPLPSITIPLSFFFHLHTDPMADSKIHPVTVNSIKNFIPITFEMEKSQYSSRAELFKIHYRAYQVIDHLTAATPPVTTPPTPAMPLETWNQLDAIVLQ